MWVHSFPFPSFLFLLTFPPFPFLSLFPTFPRPPLMSLGERLSSPSFRSRRSSPAAKRYFGAFGTEKMSFSRTVAQFTKYLHQRIQAFRWRKFQNGNRFLWELSTHVISPMAAGILKHPRSRWLCILVNCCVYVYIYIYIYIYIFISSSRQRKQTK